MTCIKSQNHLYIWTLTFSRLGNLSETMSAQLDIIFIGQSVLWPSYKIRPALELLDGLSACHGSRRRMREAGRKVAFAWLLASGCLIGHLPHWWQGAPKILHRLASPQLHAALSTLALFGEPCHFPLLCSDFFV